MISELPMKYQCNEMIYLPVTKPNQAKYCLFVCLFVCLFTCCFVVSLQKRVFRPTDQFLNVNYILTVDRNLNKPRKNCMLSNFYTYLTLPLCEAIFNDILALLVASREL